MINSRFQRTPFATGRAARDCVAPWGAGYASGLQVLPFFGGGTRRCGMALRCLASAYAQVPGRGQGTYLHCDLSCGQRLAQETEPVTTVESGSDSVWTTSSFDPGNPGGRGPGRGFKNEDNTVAKDNQKRKQRKGPKGPVQPKKGPGGIKRGSRRGGQSKSFKHRSQKNKPAPLPKGVVHIQSSFNNTIVTVTNLRGRVITWSSAGANGFKGSRKSTPFAAKIAAKAAGRVSFDQGLKLVKVNVRGGGSGRETAMRGLIDAGLRLVIIRDITGVPHNGCRPPKKRRV